MTDQHLTVEQQVLMRALAQLSSTAIRHAALILRGDALPAACYEHLANRAFKQAQAVLRAARAADAAR